MNVHAHTHPSAEYTAQSLSNKSDGTTTCVCVVCVFTDDTDLRHSVIIKPVLRHV